ncbi:STAS domain-containing protein [Streptomyces sp. NPDC001296]
MGEGRIPDTEQAEQAPPPGGLSVVATSTDGIRVLTLIGEIDHHTGEALHQALDVSGIVRPRIVVDMRRVSFMDSSGINILLAAHQAAAAAGGWLRLAAPAPAVLRTLQLVGVDQFIDCRPSLRDALSF